MIEETYTITDISTPQKQEDKDKVTKAKIVTQLQVGAICAICLGAVNAISVSNGLMADNLLHTIIGGLGTMCSGISAYSIISTIHKYEQSDLDSQNSSIESEERTR